MGDDLDDLLDEIEGKFVSEPHIEKKVVASGSSGGGGAGGGGFGGPCPRPFLVVDMS